MDSGDDGRRIEWNAIFFFPVSVVSLMYTELSSTVPYEYFNRIIARLRLARRFIIFFSEVVAVRARWTLSDKMKQRGVGKDTGLRL